jgi:arginase
LQVIGLRYGNDRPHSPAETPLDAYAASGVYPAAEAPVTITEPVFPEPQRTAETTDNIGYFCGEIANSVAMARQQGAAILVVGGNCSHMTGVIGGLQDVHGPAARIGLVWFDAHGDFNTPGTTLSGMLGGMPVAVAAGLAYPRWRSFSHMAAPLPTERIVLVDVRNLDPPELRLIRSTAATIAAVAPGLWGVDLRQAANELAEQCDLLYLHIDSDILDESYVPNHRTKEPHGPSMAQVLAAVDLVMATGKVAVLAVVSVHGDGPGGDRAIAAGIELIRGGLTAWQKYGMS